MALRRVPKLADPEVDALVAASQKGDREAFGKLYDLYVDQIYRYVYYKLPEPDVADMTEQIFLKAWEHLGSYRKMASTFAAWLFRIARNLIIDHYRVRKEVESLDPEAPIAAHRIEENPHAHVSRMLTNTTVKTALSRVKEPYQQVLILKFINEFSNEEIARIVGKPEGTVRVLQFRGLSLLKKALLGLGITDFTE